MSIIRPEVLAFLRAVQALVSADEPGGSLPLSDEETDKIVNCMTKLEKLLKDGEGHLDGDGHPGSDGHP